MGASAVCNPGLPDDVPVVPTPAAPVGVSAEPPPAPTTVTAVTTDWLPLGRVLVCTTVLVTEDVVLLLLDVVELPGEGEMVWTPPPMVETTTRPTLLVLVMISPRVGVAEEVDVVDGVMSAEVEVDVVELEVMLATGAPFDVVLVDVVVLGVEPAPAGVLVLVLVLEEVSTP